jgi:nitroimidazol reductase NimA-like FMN-containing flavoprotein (pyridoxamine 5'-phosphate oxidase superfamily)
MRQEDDAEQLQSLGRSIVDRSLYMVLATADGVGRPWATPVYFAPEEYRGFVWVSRPDARHSRNIAERPEVGITIFDSSAPISTGRAVFITATSRRLEDDERIAAVAVFSHRAVLHGGRPWTVADLERPEGVRMYRATAVEQHVNDELDRRLPVTLWP